MTVRQAGEIIDSGTMGGRQIAAIAVTVGLNALDGFDVLSIAYASPGITAEWGIGKAALGAVLSMELLGMAVGSILLGGLCDRIGRRPTILGCLIVMTVGMFMARTAGSITELSVWRVLTGLGIGGMLAATNAVAAELSNSRHRSLCMSLMVIGYPIGSVIGGTIAAQLLKGGDWRVVFEFGAIATALFVPLVWFLLPETPSFLAQRQPKGALGRLNATLARFGHPLVDSLPVHATGQAQQSLAEIFRGGLLPTTLLVTFAYFAHIISFYFLMKWTPNIVTGFGFAPSVAGGVLVWTSLGGAVGGAVFGLAAGRWGLKPVTICTMLMSTAALAWYGRGSTDLELLTLGAAIAGFCTNAGIVGLYATCAQAFPTGVRGTGTGFVIGVGRGGAALAPFLAGLLFAADFGLQSVALMMGVGSLLAALAISRLKLGGSLG